MGKENGTEKKPGADGFFREDIYFEGKQYPVRAKTEKDLYKKLAPKQKALEDGTIVMRSTTTVKRYSEEFLETYVKTKQGSAAYRDTKGIMENHILPVIGTMKLKDVKLINLQKILNSRVGHSKSHILKVKQLICRMFGTAKKNKLIPEDPSEGLIMPKATDGTNRAITDYERKCILKLAEIHRAGLWILTMLYCGCRPQETIPLQGNNIDFKKSSLRIYEALEAGTNDTIGGTKSDAGVREVPIPKVLLDKYKAANFGPFDYLFTQPTTGKRVTRSSMYAMWRNFKRELDIMMGAQVYRNQITVHAVAEDLDPYCLRHTFCTDLEAAGVPINKARDYMGHSDIALTSKIYTHKSEKSFKDSVDAINNFHSPKPKLSAKKIRRFTSPSTSPVLKKA
jgi:integrase